MTVTVSTPCPRCEGSGVYRGTRRDGSTYEGPCFACQGGGPRYRRAYGGRTPSRRADYSPAAPAPVAVAALPPSDSQWTPRQRENVAAFAAANPAAYGWLIANRGTSEFAASLLNGCARYGGLTPRQLACVVRNLDATRPVAESTWESRQAAQAAILAAAAARPGVNPDGSPVAPSLPSDSEIGFIDPIPAADPVTAESQGFTVGGFINRAPPVTVDLDRVRRAMESAAASGLRKVRLTFGEVTMKYSGPGFRFGGRGMVLCYHGGSYRGYVDAANVFHARMNSRVDEATLDAFRAVGVDPQAAARTHGNDTGYCSCCRRLLTDPPSVMAGIGPVCIRRFGWSF